MGAMSWLTVSGTAALLNAAGMRQAIEAVTHYHGTPTETASDEHLWFEIQKAFTVDRSLINLNNGGVSPSPAVVQNAMKRYLDYSNTAPVYTMWRILGPQKETIRRRLADQLGCDFEEIAITRNASEALEICQLGFDLEPGDEVLTTNQDYPRMITTWEQLERRKKVKLKMFPISTPAEDPEKIISLFRENITPRTRLILISHMIFLTGQILPVKRIVAMARKKNIPVIVDGAHSFAHIDFRIDDLDCDYFGTSLHKWLCAPHGTGLLYVRKDKIKDLWPLMPAPGKMDDDIRKFEEIGTHPAANYLAIGEALTLYQGIGAKRKEERMRYLRDRWALRLNQFDRVRLYTSLKPEFSCGIATVRIDGIDSKALSEYLWNNHKIIVALIEHADFEGVRISPNIYTTLNEIDYFGNVMEQILRNGLPKN